MAVKVQRTHGERPFTTVVLSEKVTFDENGFAEVSEEVAAVLETVPGYVVLDETVPSEPEPAEPEPAEAEPAEAEPAEPGDEKPAAPKRKAAPRRTLK